MRTGHNVTQQKRASNDRTDAQPVNQTTTKKNLLKRMSCVSTKVANHKLPKDASLFEAYIYKKIYNADTNGNHLINSSSLTCGRAGGIGGY